MKSFVQILILLQLQIRLSHQVGVVRWNIFGYTAYAPGPISQTTYYRRLSRRVGCTDWFEGESNCVAKTVINSNCGPPDQCNVTWTLEGNELVVTGLNFPINVLQVADANFSHIYICDDWSNPCQSTERIPLSPGTYYLNVQTYLDWSNEICHIFEPINVPFARESSAGNEPTIRDDISFSYKNENSIPDRNVQIFPNPADDILNVSIENFEEKAIEIRLVNLLGETMKIAPNQKTENQFQIDLSNLSTGIYILWILPEGEKPISKKLKINRSE